MEPVAALVAARSLIAPPAPILMTSVVDPTAAAPPISDVAPGRWFARVVALTTFLGAFLLFQVQPLVGSVVTPWFGGTPTVWTTSMLLFQAMLVVGYAFVYFTTRFLPPRLRSALYFVSAIGGVAMLPILPGVHWKPTPEADPMLGVLTLLLACVGAPYFLLSTTGPATQEWFARAYSNRSPYRLYSLSNLGSLLGLLTYPFIVQPLVDLPVQSVMWSVGFAVYAVLVVVCVWTVRRYPDVPPADPALDSAPGSVPSVGKKGKRFERDRAVEAPRKPKSRAVESLQWLALSAGGSVLLLATTNHLCQDMSSFPLLWVAPLVVYLLTFIICFDRPEWYRRVPTALAAFVVVPLACIPVNDLLALGSGGGPRILPVALLNLAMLFCGCMLCHGELAARKPEPQRLTFYFLMVAIGGALGGLLVGVVAPLVYDRYWEWIFASPALVLFAAILVADRWTKAGWLNPWWAKGLYFGVLAWGLYLIAQLHLLSIEPYVLSSSRNFYGVVQISGIFQGDTDNLEWASMMSGSTRHGTQIFALQDQKPATQDAKTKPGTPAVPVDPFATPSRWRTTYYGKDSGVGRLLLALQAGRLRNEPMKVGVVGLGIGTLATYARERDFYRFYEINPIVVRYADEFFTYLKECDERKASHETVVGDARLMMERESSQGYDVLVLDAFSSDAVPTHLLTTQAFEIYLRHLNSDGVLALHVSNKYLNLGSVVATAADKFDLDGLLVRHQPPRAPPGMQKNVKEHMLQQGSRWVLLTRRAAAPPWQAWKQNDVEGLDLLRRVTPWTDERCNFFEILE